ncbi:MAG: LysM peptidoglycan-binding domain-containing protein [Bacteroidia bacterium]|nr:LysM peptidoglycan-binding domain-containing protein [Bacteroidia bacterium]
MIKGKFFRGLFLCWVVMHCFSLSLLAQTTDTLISRTKRLKVPSLGIALTGTAYTGDLTDDFMKMNRIYPGLNISLQSNVNTRAFLKPQLNVGFGSVAEQADKYPFTQDHPKSVWPTSFVYTPYYYGDVRLKTRMPGSFICRPYLSAGIGLYLFSPEDADGNLLIDAPKTRPFSEIYSTASLYLPATVGLDVKISRIITLGLGYTYLNIFTDYTDNLSNLGLQEGKDALHRLQFSMYVTPAPSEAEVKIPDIYIPPVDTGKVDTLLITSNDRPRKNRRNKDRNKPVEVVATDTAAHFFVPRPLDSLILSLLDTAFTAESRVRKETSYRDDTLTIYLDTALYVLDSGNVYPASRKYNSLTKIVSEIEDSVLFREQMQVKEEQLYVNQQFTQMVDSVSRQGQTWNKVEPEVVNPEIARQRQKELIEKEKFLIEKKKFIYYEVKRRDNLDIIANKFQLRKSTIMRLNSMTSEKVEAGTVLRLPDMEYQP